MSKYTTGEIAKLCGVTVRTVQYYDTRGILIPSELSEGGRRLVPNVGVKAFVWKSGEVTVNERDRKYCYW